MIAPLLAQAAGNGPSHLESYTLQPSGWIVMLLSVGFVTGLLLWCVWRIVRESRPQKLHGQIDVDTHDFE